MSRRSKMILSSLIIFFAVMWSPGVQGYHSSLHMPGIDGNSYIQAGDINLGFMVMLHDAKLGHEFCSDTLASAYRLRLVEACAFAVREINERNDILPNITLGFVIQDDCARDVTALARAVQMVNLGVCLDQTQCTNNTSSTSKRIVGVVGPNSDGQSVMVAGYLSLFHIPMLSTYSSTDELTDDARYGYFLGLVPPTVTKAQGWVEILLQYNWTFISIVHSAGHLEEDANNLRKAIRLSGRTICTAVDTKIESNAGTQDFEIILEKLQRYSKAKIVFLFTETYDGLNLLNMAKASGMFDTYYWLGHVKGFPDQDLGDILHGSIAFSSSEEKVDENFEQYFQSLKVNTIPDNPWVYEAWEMLFHCNWESEEPGSNDCASYENNTVSDSGQLAYSWGWESRYIDGVRLYARALDVLIRNDCPNASHDKLELDTCLRGSRLLDFMKNTSFTGLTGQIQFDRDGNFIGPFTVKQFSVHSTPPDFQSVGIWDTQTMQLNLNTDDMLWKDGRDEHGQSLLVHPPTSQCSIPCGEKQYYLLGDSPCCWTCVECQHNEIIFNQSRCLRCAPLTWPDPATATACVPIAPYSLEWDDPRAIGLLSAALVSFVLALTISCFYVYYRKTRLIKASGRDMSAVMMAGCVLALVTSFVLLLRPTWATCFWTKLGFSLTTTIVYAPLWMKTLRVYIIFKEAKRSTKIPRFSSRKTQLIGTLVLCCLQVVISTLLLLMEPPEVKLRMPILNEKFVETYCHISTPVLLIPFIFNVILSILCAACGFLTRKLPENYNESWYIFLCVTTTVMTWTTFLPTYFTVFYASSRNTLMSLYLILAVDIVLLFLYGPKCFAVFFVDQDQISFNVSGGYNTGTRSNRLHPSSANSVKVIEIQEASSSAQLAMPNDDARK